MMMILMVRYESHDDDTDGSYVKSEEEAEGKLQSSAEKPRLGYNLSLSEWNKDFV